MGSLQSYFWTIFFFVMSTVIIVQYWGIDMPHGAGLALIPIGLALMWAGFAALGEAWAILPQAKTLKTGGIYSKIRHPIYLGVALILSGWSVYIWSSELAFITILVTVLSVVRARLEERVLRKQFGKAYEEYRHRTWF